MPELFVALLAAEGFPQGIFPSIQEQLLARRFVDVPVILLLLDGDEVGVAVLPFNWLLLVGFFLQLGTVVLHGLESEVDQPSNADNKANESRDNGGNAGGVG